MINPKRLVNLLVGSLFLAGLSITTALLPAPLAYADCDIGDRLDPFNRDCHILPPINGGGGGRNWFAISFKNSCNVPIQVAIKQFFPANSGGGRGSDSGTEQYIPAKWVPQGWWRINPGETALVANQELNSNLYYYAESIGGSTRVWSGNDSYGVLKGVPLHFKRVNMGNEFVDFTMNLTCN